MWPCTYGMIIIGCTVAALYKELICQSWLPARSEAHEWAHLLYCIAQRTRLVFILFWFFLSLLSFFPTKFFLEEQYDCIIGVSEMI